MPDLNSLFTESVKGALTQIKAVADPTDRAKLFVDLAAAIASTGCITSTISKEAVEEVAVAKEDLEPKPKKKEKKEAVADSVDPKEAEREWGSPELAEKYKQELEFIETLATADKEYSTTYLSSLLSEFSSGAFDSQASIKPFNISAIVTNIQAYMQEQYNYLNGVIEANGDEAILNILGLSSLEEVNDTNILPAVAMINAAMEQSEEAAE